MSEMFCTPPRQTKPIPASCPAAEASTSAWPPRTSSRPYSQPAPMVRPVPQSPPTPTKRSFSRASRPIFPPRQHSGSLVAQIALQNLSLHAWEVNPFEQSFIASSPPPPSADSPKRWAALVGLPDAPSSPPPVPAPPVAVNLFGYEAVAMEGEQLVQPEQFTWQGQGQSQQAAMLAPPELQSKWSVSSYGASDSDEEHNQDDDDDSEGEDALDSITDYYFTRTYSKTDSESSRGSSFFGRRRSSPFGLEPPSTLASPAVAQAEWRPCGQPLREVDNATPPERAEMMRTQVALLRKRTRSDTASAPIQPKRSMEWTA